jgi:hypothetical protein
LVFTDAVSWSAVQAATGVADGLGLFDASPAGLPLSGFVSDPPAFPESDAEGVAEVFADGVGEAFPEGGGEGNEPSPVAPVVGLAPMLAEALGDAEGVVGADGLGEPVSFGVPAGTADWLVGGAARPGLPPMLTRKINTMINSTSIAPTTRARRIQ